MKTGRRKWYTRWIAVCVAIVLGVGICEGLTVCAAYENTHTNTGNQRTDIVEVAKTQIGYHEGSLEGTTNGSNNYTKYNVWNGKISGYGSNGYGYAWCHAFVSWCANQAGIGTDIIPKTAGTSTGRSFFVNQGTYRQSAANGGNYVPQSGDIIYYGSGSSPSHVGIVSSCDGGTVYTIEGNYSNKVGTRAISLSNSYIIGYGVPNYRGNSNPPTNLSITSDKTAYKVGETINFSFSYSNATDVYILIDANGVRVEPWANVTGQTSYSCTFNEPGYYVYRLYAVNEYGTPATEWKVFTVYDKEPDNMFIQCDKNSYAVGETINFNFSVNNAETAYVLIDANGTRVEPWANVTGQTSYSCTFNEPGYYVYRLYAVNEYGTPATEWKVFTVYDKEPDNLSIQCDKDCYAVGETINFNFSVNNAETAYILIDANGTRVEPWANVTGKTSYSYTFDEPGRYVYRLYAVNKYGTPATEWKVFTVYDKEPDNLSIQCDKDYYAVGEAINFDFSVNNAETAYILIDANGVRVEPWADVTGQTNYSYTFDEPGRYVYRLYAVNKYGTPATEWKEFYIYKKFDVNADGKINTADAALLQSYLTKNITLTKSQGKAADLNEDGLVDGFDLALLRQKLAA